MWLTIVSWTHFRFFRRPPSSIPWPACASLSETAQGSATWSPASVWVMYTCWCPAEFPGSPSHLLTPQLGDGVSWNISDVTVTVQFLALPGGASPLAVAAEPELHPY